MTFDEEDYFNHESLLVVTEKGLLKRLKIPFKVVVLVGVDHLYAGNIYLVGAVLSSSEHILLYAIDGRSYCYYWFMVMG